MIFSFSSNQFFFDHHHHRCRLFRRFVSFFSPISHTHTKTHTKIDSTRTQAKMVLVFSVFFLDMTSRMMMRKRKCIISFYKHRKRRRKSSTIVCVKGRIGRKKNLDITHQSKSILFPVCVCI